MDENKIIRQKIIIAIVSFVGLIGIISLLVVTFSKGPDVPPEVTLITEQRETTTNTLSVYNIGVLVVSNLTSVQVTHIEQELKEFILDYKNEDITYLSVVRDTLTFTQGNPSQVTFLVSSNNGTTYTVKGDYVAEGDMFIRIYSDQGTQVYEEHYDVDSE